jgi:hypothetical protein
MAMKASHAALRVFDNHLAKSFYSIGLHFN